MTLALSSNMAGMKGGLWPAAFLLLTTVCTRSRVVWRGVGGWGVLEREKDKHWSMLSGALISLVYRPFPALPKLNDLHTNRPSAVSIYSGNISIKEIKPYKPRLITVLLPFLITRATFFNHRETSLLQRNSTHHPTVNRAAKHSWNAVNRLESKNKSNAV